MIVVKLKSLGISYDWCEFMKIIFYLFDGINIRLLGKIIVN